MRSFCIYLLAVLAPCIAAASVHAESPRKLVDRGNKSYARSDYDDAIAYYEKASVRAPESPIVAFNTGNAHYRRGEFAVARGFYEDAALKAEQLSFEAGAWYNAGNCAFREGERQVDGDPEKALEFFEESVQLYTTSQEKDPELIDAAHNIEVARLIIKNLLDEIKKRQEESQKQQERMQAVVDSLRALVARQEKAAAGSRELENSPERGTSEWNAGLRGVEEQQEWIAGGTGAVRDSLHAFFPDTIPKPVENARSHIDSSLTHQGDAANGLSGRDAGRAAADQDLSLDQLKKALDALTENQDGSDGEGRQQEQQTGEQPQQQPQEEPAQQEQQEQQKASETARGILEEEKENKEKRHKAAQGYRSVDRDW